MSEAIEVEELKLDVELRPMFAEKKTVLGVLKQPLKQSEVIVNEKRVGFICDHEGAPLNFIEPLPDELKDAIRGEVELLREETVGETSQPPSNEAVTAAIAEQEKQARREAGEDVDDEGDDDDGDDLIVE